MSRSSALPPVSTLVSLVLGSFAFLIGVLLVATTDRMIIGITLLVLGAMLEGVSLIGLISWSRKRSDKS